MHTDLAELRQAVKDAYAQLESAARALEAPEADADLDALKGAFDEADAAHQSAVEAVERSERIEEARAALPVEDAEVDVKVVSEPLTYERHAPNSIFRDMVSSQKGDNSASQRLERHMAEMRVESRTSSLVAGTDADGGYLVAPLWLNEQLVTLARPGRRVVDAVGTKPLPPNTDSINIPTVDTGTAVAAQTEANGAQDTAATFSSVTGAVQTIAGIQNVSQQLLDRAVPGIDEVIFGDLVRAYAGTLETAFLNSSTTNAKGIGQVSGVNAVTYTASTPTAAGLFAKIGEAIQAVESNIYEAPTHIVMSARRWQWLLTSTDSTNRPLLTQYQPMNNIGSAANPAAEGAVGSLLGLPVIVSGNVPLTAGSGTNEDRIYVFSAPNLLIFEDSSGPFLDTFRDVLSSTLQVRLRLFNYYALINGRRPKAISVVAGTGLANPY